MDPAQALAAEIRVRLSRIGDPVRAAGQQRYMKSDMPYRGVTTPQLQAVLRGVLTREAFPLPTADAWESAIRDLYDNAAFREERYAAVGVARHPRHRVWAPRLESLPLYEHLIRTGAWWDLVDTTSALVGVVLRANVVPGSAVMRAWAHDDSVWMRRAAIISQLAFKDATDVDLLVDTITPSLADPDFFARKAIGWALRQYGRTDPEWVRGFVSDLDSRLSPLSRREAMKHLAKPTSP